MTTKFKKGDAVTHIASWDGNGTVCYRHLTVHSCGRVQMILNYYDGTCAGRHFRPDGGDMLEIRKYGGFTMHRKSEKENIILCLVAAEAFLTDKRTHLAQCLDNSAKHGYGEGYDRSIQKDIDALHEPRVNSHDELVNAL